MKFCYKGFLIDYDYVFNFHKENIIFLHGWGGDKKSFEFMYNLLTNKFNILSISFPPYFTKKIQSPISLDMNDYLEIIIRILSLLNIKELNIICHSFGFRLALILSSTDIKIKSIIITGGAGINLRHGIFNKIRYNKKLIDNKLKIAKGEKLEESDYTVLDNIDKKTFKNIVNFNSTNYLRFDCPTLIFWGKLDSATPLKIGRYINKKIKNSKLIIVNSDHFAYLNYLNLFETHCLKFYKEIYG